MAISSSTISLIVAALIGYSAPRAVDGDTVEIDGEIIRILNIDTPEIHAAKCANEKLHGEIAKKRTGQLLQTGAIQIRRGDGKRMKDRYGRTLARLYIKGRDLGEILMREGLARRWDGKRHPWCK